jgi:SAM-dependent methyltransferase
MHDRHTDKELYFREQVYTTEKYVVPFIRRNRDILPGMKVMEIGCGEGGNLKPFLDLGCIVTGIDISPAKIENALKFYPEIEYSSRVRFITKDIYLAADELTEEFDIVIMRDVIEHIHDQKRFMGFVKRFLKPDGMFFLAFPPWYNPFGGHQQVAENRFLSKLPYYHLFPPPVYRFILRAGGESDEKIEAFLEIKHTGISIERFKKILKHHNYKIISEIQYFINPNYEIKFGLKPRKQAAFITAIPLIRNFFVTACYFLIQAEKRQG